MAAQWAVLSAVLSLPRRSEFDERSANLFEEECVRVRESERLEGH